MRTEDLTARISADGTACHRRCQSLNIPRTVWLRSLNATLPQLKLLLPSTFELTPSEVITWALQPEKYSSQRHVEIAKAVRSREEEALDVLKQALPPFCGERNQLVDLDLKMRKLKPFLCILQMCFYTYCREY